MKDTRTPKPWEVMQLGIDPKHVPPQKLIDWMLKPRQPLLFSEDDLVRMFIDGMLSGEPVKFVYAGGSHPGATRQVKVSLVFQHEPEGRIYVSGYCLDRAANRIFSLDWIMVIHAWN
jgi:predicted DNA-binding transcriptional regulator YafY